MQILSPRLRSILGLTLALFLAPSLSAQVHASHAFHGRGSYASSRTWIPGRFETVQQRVWVPGWIERVWIEPTYEWRFGSCGSRFRIQVCAGHWKSVHHPGHYESRRVQVWQPGHWEARGCR